MPDKRKSLKSQIGRVFRRRHKKGDLWNWATKPRRAERRVKRWKALAEFASRRKALNKTLGKVSQAKAWAEAKTIYRDKFEFLKKDIKKRKRTASLDKKGFSNPDRPWNPYHRDIPNWMIPWLDKIYEICPFVVISGVRTPEYSEELCYNMCGAPSCPGRCAGRASNHNMEPHEEYPEGALDVSNHYNFGAAAKRVGAPLINALGAADPNHFSVSGR